MDNEATSTSFSPVIAPVLQPTGKVGRNVFFLIASKVLASILVFLAYATLFRYLGTYASGQFQFSLAYVTLFSVVVSFGLETLVIKQVSEHPDRAGEYMGTFFAVEVYISLIVFAALVAIAFAAGYDPLVRMAIIVGGAGMCLDALDIPMTAVISAHQDMGILATMNFTDSVVNALFIFSAVLFHKWIVFLAFVQLANAVIHLVVYLRVTHRYVPGYKLWIHFRYLNWDKTLRIMRDALPFGMLVGFSIIYNKIDVVILAHIRGYAETGLYTSAYKFFDLLSFVPGTISSALYPFFSSQMKAGNLVAVRTYLERYTKLMLGLGLPIAVGGLAVAPRMMLLLGGPQFYGGYPALQIIVFGTAVLFTYGAVNSLMINQLTRYAAAITFINIFINTIGNILLIPHFGFKAAAAMTVASEVFQASCYFYFVQTRIVKFSFWAGTWKAVLAAAVMLAVIWPLRNDSLAVTLPLGAVVYALVALATGFVSRADIDSIKNLRRAAA